MRGENSSMGPVSSMRRRLIGLAGALTLGAGALFALTAPAVMASGGGGPAITGISVNNDCFLMDTSGTLTVANPVDGMVTLEVYAHSTTGGGAWDPTGATVIVDTNTSQTSYGFEITNIPSQYFASPYNSLRIQVESATGGYSGTTTKSGSFDGCASVVVAESPLAVGLPIAGLILFVGGFAAMVVVRRRRSVAAGL